MKRHVEKLGTNSMFNGRKTAKVIRKDIHE